MSNFKTMVVTSAILFVVFFVNVMLSAFGGGSSLPDVGEALLLLTATIVFVAAMLAAETRAKSNSNSNL